ncbi:MAG TPA: YezD family protein [Methylophilaceae bacterium]
MKSDDHSVVALQQKPALDKASDKTLDRKVLEDISRMLADLRFGSVEITVHENRVTQIERKEKVRFN